MTRPSRFRQWIVSLLILLGAGTGAALLFLINRIVVATLCIILLPGNGVQITKLRTMIMLILPVLLILPEWWVFDSITYAIGRLLRVVRQPRRHL